MHFWTLQVEVILHEATSSACNEGSEEIRKVGVNKCLGVIYSIWLFNLYNCQPMGGISVMHLSPLAVAHATQVQVGCNTILKFIAATLIVSTCAITHTNLFVIID